MTDVSHLIIDLISQVHGWYKSRKDLTLFGQIRFLLCGPRGYVKINALPHSQRNKAGFRWEEMRQPCSSCCEGSKAEKR